LSSPAFWGTFLVNLPTTQAIGKHDALFRISHRYFSAINTGYETYFGINGPASILISMGYGITDNLNLTIGHTNSLHEWEFSAKWVGLKSGRLAKLPLSIALNGSMGWITQKLVDRSLLESDNFRYTGQLICAYQFSDVLAIVAVPGITSRSQFWDNSDEQILTLGTGTRFSFWGTNSLIGEWIPILNGPKTNHNGWGIGLESKIGGHVFQVFITNAYGITRDQFLSGGDLNIRNNDYRIGFNIFRTFWF